MAAISVNYEVCNMKYAAAFVFVQCMQAICANLDTVCHLPHYASPIEGVPGAR